MIQSKKFHIFILLTIFIAFLVYSFLDKKEESSKEVIINVKEYILGSFLNELPEINKKLPHKIDGQTTLISIRYENNKILSIYELPRYVISDEFLNKIKPSIRKQACGDEMKKKLLEVDVVFLDRYQNPTGDVLFEVLLNKSECA
jgi:hypothetical protein